MGMNLTQPFYVTILDICFKKYTNGSLIDKIITYGISVFKAER